MIRDTSTEIDVKRYLHERASPSGADYLGEVLAETARTPQRRWWSSPERWLPMDIAARPVAGPLPWRPVAALLALLLALAAMALVYVGSRPRLPEPFGLAANGAMAFWRDGDIWFANADGSNERVAIGGPSNDLAPGFSPDGTRFLFNRVVSPGETQLMVASANGGDVRELTPALQTPDWSEWSPSSREVAVVHTNGVGRVVTIYDAVDDAAPRDLDVGNLEVSNAVWWRPGDDQELIFRATPRGRIFEPALYRIGLDGSGLERITALGTNEYEYQNITLSADGRTAAYWSWEADQSDDDMGGYLHTLDLETGGTIAHKLGSGKWLGPQFSPDGRTLGLIANIGDNQRLGIGTLDSTEARIIGPAIPFDTPWSFMFSPDGSKVAVNVEGEETWLVDVATGGEGTRTGIKYFAGWQRLAP